MVKDWLALTRAYLLSRPEFTAIVGDRIYASDSFPPSYSPSQGVGVLFSARGGGQNDSSTVLTVAAQFRLYGATLPEIVLADRTLFKVLNNQDTVFLSARMTQPSQQLTEKNSNTPWLFMLSFYVLKLSLEEDESDI